MLIMADLITYAFHYIVVRTLYDGLLRSGGTGLIVLAGIILYFLIKFLRKIGKKVL